MKNTFRHLRFLFPLTLLGGVAACASNPELNPRELQRAQMAIQEAKEVNAGQHAAGTLARAEERLTQAQEAVKDGHEQKAQFLLDESAALAQLAEARSLERDSDQALTQIRDNLAALQQQLD